MARHETGEEPPWTWTQGSARTSQPDGRSCFRAACLLCGDPHRAEDIVQDALVRLYRAWDRVSSVENVDAYVRRIIVNAHYSDRRRPWRRESVREVPEVPLEPGFPVEEADTIWRALRGLPPGQRRVIVLRHIWGLSVDETARELETSPGTVKSQSSDALAALRRALTPDLETTSRATGDDR